MACYYIVISSTHLSNGHFRNIKGVFRGPLGKNGNKNLDYAEKERTTTRAKALEDLKANFYCQLCDKQYHKHQEFDNHINSYDHAHTQRLKELKQREFARNVASKTRKDERKQERALRRLHELAEQRREVQCAPGSGPKFKSTTVAVESSSRESGLDGPPEQTHSGTVPETGAHQNQTSSTGMATSSKAQQTLFWPYTGKARKQAYNRHKIAFSFSFPKKASVKLESSAAVFCESLEEGSRERARRQKLRMPLVELNIPVSTAADGKAPTGGTLVFGSDSNRSGEGSQAPSERPAAVPEPDLTPAALPDPDLCTVLVYSQNRAGPGVSTVSQSPVLTRQTPSVPTATALDTQHSQETRRNSPMENEPSTTKHTCDDTGDRSVPGKGYSDCIGGTAPGVDVSQPSFSTSFLAQPSQSPMTMAVQEAEVQDEEKVKENDITVLVKTPSGPFIKPRQPFFSVLSRDGSTVLQWPSEMLAHTRTEPCLSHSCNPLHFDFRAPQPTQSNVKVQVSVGDGQSRSEQGLLGAPRVSSEEPMDRTRHKGEVRSASDHPSPVRYDHQACLICQRHLGDTDTESCSSRPGRHSRGRSASRSSRRLKGHRGKREGGAGKWRPRVGRHYRSHKKKRRRRRGEREEERRRDRETDGGGAERCNTSRRRSECREEHDRQIRSPTSQRLLEKSKQSAQNQAEGSCRATPSTAREKEAGREMLVDWGERSSRQETAGGLNGSAGSLSDEGASDAEKAFGRSSGRDPVHSSTEQRSTAGQGSTGHSCATDLCHDGAVGPNPSMSMTHLSPQRPGTIELDPGPVSPAGSGEGSCNSPSLKRKRTECGEQDRDPPCSKCPPPPDVLEDGEATRQHGCVSCGREARQRKTPRGSGSPTHGPRPPHHAAPDPNAVLPPFGDGRVLGNVPGGTCASTTARCLVLDGCTAPSQPASEGINTMGSPALPQTQDIAPSQSLPPSLPVPVRASRPPEVICITDENRKPTMRVQTSPTVSLAGLVGHLKTCDSVSDSLTGQGEVLVHPPGRREVYPPPQVFQIQMVGLDMSCQPGPQMHHHQGCPNPQPAQLQMGHPGVSGHEERGVRESMRTGTTNTSGSSCSPYHRPASPYHLHKPACFQHPSEAMEKHHCLVQIQTHRHILHQHHQHQVFPGKMKQVLPGSPVSMSPSCPPMLHPVQLSPPPMSPMPTGSITIRHTILQHHHHHHAFHHAAFLSPHPQPTLFPQVLPVPVSRLPMGAEMCSPGPPPFVTSPPQLSVVAPPNSHHHPMTVTFHAMPRPAIFPASMLQPQAHPAVIPLRPLF